MSEIKSLLQDIEELELLNEELLEKATRYLVQRDKLIEALEDISHAEGAYNEDRLKHAENTIDNMKSIALKAIK